MPFELGLDFGCKTSVVVLLIKKGFWCWKSNNIDTKLPCQT